MAGESHAAKTTTTTSTSSSSNISMLSCAPCSKLAHLQCPKCIEVKLPREGASFWIALKLPGALINQFI